MTTDRLGIPLWPPEVPAAPAPKPVRAATPLFLTLALAALAHALTSGVHGQLGLNAAVWVAVFGLVSVWAVQRKGLTPSREALTLLLSAFAFALLGTVWSPPGEFMALNVLALLVSLVLGAAYLRHPGLLETGFWNLIGSGITGGLRFVYGPFVVLERYPWAQLKPKEHGKAGSWGVGLLLTLPILAVFGTLLASADANFSALFANLLHWEWTGLGDHLFMLVFWGAFAGGLIYAALLAARPTLLPETIGSPAQLGLIEVGLPLVSLGGLFTVFLLAQLPYFLSGTLPGELTFAEYIRKGFGELMNVAFLTLVLLLVAHAITRPQARATATYRLLNLAVLAPLALVILSAANRWRLYTLAYGLSEIRVLGAAFLVWVVASLLWLAYLLWRGDLRRFAYPSLLMGLVTLLLTTMLNPAALIARTNIHRQTAKVTNGLRSTPQQADVWTLINLGPDALPVVLANLDKLTYTCGPLENCGQMNSKERVVSRLYERYAEPRDPRAWNASEARAYALVRSLPK